MVEDQVLIVCKGKMTSLRNKNYQMFMAILALSDLPSEKALEEVGFKKSDIIEFFGLVTSAFRA